MSLRHGFVVAVVLLLCDCAIAQYDSVRYDMTTQNVHWNSLSDFNSRGFNPDTLSKPLYCQSETTPVFVANFSKSNDYNSNVATATNVLDAGSHWNVAGVYTKKHYDLTTHSVRIKGAFVCRTTTQGNYNEYWLGAIPVSNKNYHAAIYGGGNTPEGYIVGAWVDWWCARTRGTPTMPDEFFVNRINSNMPLGLFFEAMAEFKIVHDSVMMVKYTLTPPVNDSYQKQEWTYPGYRSTPFEPLTNAAWFKDFRPAFMADDGLDWVEVIADPLPCTMELKKKSYSACEGSVANIDLSTFIWLKSQSINNKTGVFYLRKTSNSKANGYLHKALINAMLPKNLPIGDYMVSYISPCGDSIQFPVNILSGPKVQLRDTVLCKGVVFKPTGSVQSPLSIDRYNWECGSNVGSTIQPIWTMNDTGFINLVLSATDTYGCVGSDTAKVYVSAVDGLSIAVNDSIQCFNGHAFDLKLNVSSQNSNTYRWILPTNQTQLGRQLSNLKFAAQGTFKVKIIGNTIWGCKDSNELNLLVLESPKTVVFDTQVCENQWFHFRHADKVLLNPIVQHQWNFISADSFVENPIYLLSKSGQYSVRLIVVNAAGCSDTSNAKVTVHPNPKINYDFRFIDNLNGGSRWSYAYTGTQGAKVEWLVGEKRILTGAGPGIVNLDQFGLQNFKIRVTSDKGCIDSLSFSKTISSSNNLYFPNAFTPDGRGGNEVFGPYNADLIENYQMRVYNRWGEKLFESTPQNRYWDGTDSKGEPAMEGQYVYLVTGVRNTGDILSHAGTVYLIRTK